MRSTLVAALDEIRRIVNNLRPPSLDDLGLIPALRSYARSHLEAQDVRLDWRVEGSPYRLAPPIETALFRIVQEGINNVVRHARAQNARIEIAYIDGRVIVSLEDDGIGFTPEAALRQGGSGLLGMQERASLLRGSLRVDSQPGRGTRLQVEVPVSWVGGEYEQDTPAISR